MYHASFGYFLAATPQVLQEGDVPHLIWVAQSNRKARFTLLDFFGEPCTLAIPAASSHQVYEITPATCSTPWATIYVLVAGRICNPPQITVLSVFLGYARLRIPYTHNSQLTLLFRCLVYPPAFDQVVERPCDLLECVHSSFLNGIEWFLAQSSRINETKRLRPLPSQSD